jgi:hypothetical protein
VKSFMGLARYYRRFTIDVGPKVCTWLVKGKARPPISLEWLLLLTFCWLVRGLFYQDKGKVGLAEWYGWGPSLVDGTLMTDQWNNRKQRETTNYSMNNLLQEVQYLKYHFKTLNVYQDTITPGCDKNKSSPSINCFHRLHINKDKLHNSWKEMTCHREYVHHAERFNPCIEWV